MKDEALSPYLIPRLANVTVSAFCEEQESRKPDFVGKNNVMSGCLYACICLWRCVVTCVLTQS